jgi:anion-transporting  ArsA/GET3 family ATPase
MLDQRFIIIGGKGGVGRTTVSAALAVALARGGKRVLLAHVRTKQRMSQLLGGPEIDEKIRMVEPNLWAVNMTPQSALREKGLMVLRFKTVYRAVIENRLVRYFLQAIPALNEYAMLGKAWYHTTEIVDGRPKYDTVILDGPAMGHLVTMLRIPQVITDLVPPGPLSSDAREARTLLEDPRQTGLWIVTLAEEMPVREAAELYQKARNDLHIRPCQLVVNSLYPDDFARDPISATELLRLATRPAPEQVRPLIRSSMTLYRRREINAHYLEKLQPLVPLPRLELPHLFAPELHRSEIDALAAHIELALSGGGAAPSP